MSSDDDDEGKYLGCYEDNNQRVLYAFGIITSLTPMTQEYCINVCRAKKHKLAGVENGNECYCGDSLGSAPRKPDSECDINCKGNAAKKCGGAMRLGVFETGYNGGDEHDAHIGCFEDNKSRILDGSKTEHKKHMTPEYCMAHCLKMKYKLAGVKDGRKCFCGNSVGSAPKKPKTECKHPCPGNPSKTCGGDKHIEVFKTGHIEHEHQALYMGCFEDGPSRTLTGASGILARGMTPQKCVNYCRSHGLSLAGLEVGWECYCGNKMNKMVGKSNADCNMVCSGDPSRLCGGPYRLSVYATGIISG